MRAYLGIDVGSVTTKFALLDEAGELIASTYLRTRGNPISAVQEGLRDLNGRTTLHIEISGVGTTGSARSLVGVIVGADIVKNEITAQAIAALHYFPDVHTIIEIGGQDSKLIVIRDGIVTDFAMNSVCAAGTGSFLDQQAGRLGMRVEDFGSLALESTRPVRIAGRCTVFAESDMIHKQQMGYRTKDIVNGLCHSLVRNYLSNLCLGKELLPPIVFQGGVAFNKGILRAFKEVLNVEVLVPLHHEVMGAIGAALIARDEVAASHRATVFKGFEATGERYSTSSFECRACANVCEISQVSREGQLVARWGGRCDLMDVRDGEQAGGTGGG